MGLWLVVIPNKTSPLRNFNGWDLLLPQKFAKDAEMLRSVWWRPWLRADLSPHASLSLNHEHKVMSHEHIELSIVIELELESYRKKKQQTMKTPKLRIQIQANQLTSKQTKICLKLSSWHLVLRIPFRFRSLWTHLGTNCQRFAL